MSASRISTAPWWYSRGWQATIAVMASLFIVGFGYVAWWAEHQKPEDTPPVLAFVLVPFAAIGPAFPSWLQLLVLAVLNVAIWTAIAYAAIAMVARFRR